MPGLDTRLGDTFTANPIHSPAQHGRQGIDPRLARKFLRSKDTTPEEKTQLRTYIIQSKWEPDSRAVYEAILDQFSTLDEISGVTGLTPTQVNKKVAKLRQKGMVRRTTPK